MTTMFTKAHDNKTNSFSIENIISLLSQYRNIIKPKTLFLVESLNKFGYVNI